METLGEKLRRLADLYETPAFLADDPSGFMHRFTNVRDAEVVAFISANLAFGRRTQILAHLEQIFGAMQNSPAEWITSDSYLDFFGGGDSSFYRMFSHNDMILFCSCLSKMLRGRQSLGEFFFDKWNAASCTPILSAVLADAFPKNCKIISHGKNSAAKRLQLLLRWLVRKNSPVDLGLWTWFSAKNLLLPLDTHVMQQATKLGLIQKTASGKIPAPSLRLAQSLTAKLSEFFPNDPVRADYALFGLGAIGE